LSDIQEAFSVFGKIESCDMIKDPTTDTLRGFAFLRFARASEAAKAKEAMNFVKLCGRTITV